MLFGADLLPIEPEQYRVYFRLLETDDEYFSYSHGSTRPTAVGTSRASASSADVLEQVYRARTHTAPPDARAG